MNPDSAQTWMWTIEHEEPQDFRDALALCDYHFTIELYGAPITGYAQMVTSVGNITRLTKPIIDYSERVGGSTLKFRYIQHPAYFIVNCPVLYWPRRKKEISP